MEIIFTAAEQQATRSFNRKLSRLIGNVPGAGKIAEDLLKSSEEPIDFVTLRRTIDSTQLTISLEDGSLRLWINPEATEAALELALDQYSLVMEIGIALYPIARLAKRLFAEFAGKMEAFASRFTRKPSPLLGASIAIKSGGWEGVPVTWREGWVDAVHGETVIARLKSSRQYLIANKDGELYYASSSSIFDLRTEAIASTDIAAQEWDTVD